jgi:glycosyltransferase involved in cell wall biosynthesis
MKNISLIVPSHNNLRHLKNLYTSVKKHASDCELILIDDASTDGTWEWLQEIKDDVNLIIHRSEYRKGHTILYDIGVNIASNEIVGILHADMIVGPNYINNILKHLKPNTVVCGTRIEPPLHPEGREKIIKDFGLDFDTLDIFSFEEYCIELQYHYNNKISNGMFAPWIIYKEDFNSIGGHDSIFAPFPYEDSDLFQRWLLNGYELVQSRDAFVYHLTCRGHRWTDEIRKDSDDFKLFEKRARKNYLRKWGSWVKNDVYQHPIISPVYHKTLVIRGLTTLNFIEFLEPLFNKILMHNGCKTIVNKFLDLENELNSIEPPIKCELDSKFVYYDEELFSVDDTNVAVFIDAGTIKNEDIDVITNLNDIVKDTNEIGEFEYGNIKIHIKDLKEKQNELIFNINRDI